MTENAFAPSNKYQGFFLFGTRDRLGLNDFFNTFTVGFIENLSLKSSISRRMTDFFQPSTEVTFKTTEASFVHTSSTIIPSTITVKEVGGPTLVLDKNSWMGSVCPVHGNYANFTSCKFINDELTADCSNSPPVGVGHILNTVMAQ